MELGCSKPSYIDIIHNRNNETILIVNAESSKSLPTYLDRTKAAWRQRNDSKHSPNDQTTINVRLLTYVLLHQCLRHKREREARACLPFIRKPVN